MIYNILCYVCVRSVAHKESVNSATHLFVDVIVQCSKYIVVCVHHIVISHSGPFQYGDYSILNHNYLIVTFKRRRFVCPFKIDFLNMPLEV
jgi:hypothetical protein